MAELVLPDGHSVKVNAGQRIFDVLQDKEKKYLVAKVDGKLVDLTYQIEEKDREIHLLTFYDREGREVYWHSSAHILAQAVKRLFPQAKLTIGPPIENGFYYDFYTAGYAFTPQDLKKIEKEAKRIIKENLKIERKVLSKEEAYELFKKLNEPFKLELLEEIEDETVTVYSQGDFIDLCRGPHVPSTGYIKAFKVLSASAAYWRGNEKGPVLQRIYGISFPTKEELEDYIRKLEEAKKRDHRTLGKQLELFMFSKEVGPGLVLWKPKGAIVRRIIEDFLFKEHIKRGYQPVYTPHVGRAELWQISGHLEFYRENMYSPMDIEGEEYFVKPMNCPFHIQIYKSKLRSYRDLPIRLFEFGTVYRYERSGVLHGLTRVRGFTQDDAHIFARPDQVEDEILEVIDMALYILNRFGFKEFEIFVSTRPEKFVGSEEMWELATESLINSLKKAGLDFQIEEGEGAFYGPKIDILIKDAIGRPWQCTTIQFDFNLPEKFDVTYRDKDGKDKRPYMIHRALIGSMERFFGVLIEHYGGAFPLWLAPVQVVIIPISDKNLGYAEKVYEKLLKEGLRVELDRRAERVGYKLREHELQKVPYMVVVGAKEEESNTISVRRHREGDLGKFSIEDFLRKLRDELAI